MSVKTIVGFDTSHRMCASSRKCHVDCQDFFWVNSHLELCGGIDVSFKRSRRESFPFWLDFLVRNIFYLEGIAQRFWSLHLTLGPIVFQKWVVSMRIGRHHSAHCLRNHKFLSILMWCWLILLPSRVCRIDSAFQPSWENNFCNSLSTTDIATRLCSIWGISNCLKGFEFYEFVVIPPLMKWFCLGIQLVCVQNGTFQLSISIQPSEYTWRLPEFSG